MSATISAEIVACIVSHRSILASAEETATVAAGSEASAYKSVVLSFLVPNLAVLVADNGTLRNGVAGEILTRHPRLNRTTISTAWGAYRVSAERFNQCSTVKAMQALAGERKGDKGKGPKLSPAAAARAALVASMKRAFKAGIVRDIALAELNVYWPEVAPVATVAPVAPVAPAPVETAPVAPTVSTPAPAPAPVKKPRTRKAPAQVALSTPAPAPVALAS